MSISAATLPLTLSERLPLGERLVVPASWDEFLYWLPRCPYRIEYHNHEILSFMGYASEDHEKLVLNIARLLQNVLDEERYECFGSNLALHIPDGTKRYFNADCTVVEGATARVLLTNNMYAVANPTLLVEVLSPSTRAFDMETKIPRYRLIPSLQQIIIIDSTEMWVVNQVRVADSAEWRLQDFFLPTDSIPVLNQAQIALDEIYRKVRF